MHFQISDAALPAAGRRTRTNIRKFTNDTALMPSGLLGPVSMLAAGKSERQVHAVPRFDRVDRKSSIRFPSLRLGGSRIRVPAVYGRYTVRKNWRGGSAAGVVENWKGAQLVCSQVQLMRSLELRTP